MPLGLNFKHFIGKQKARSQMIFLRTTDGRAVEREVLVMADCAIDEDTCSGFLIDSNNQYKNEDTGHWFQLDDEGTTIPISLITPSPYQGKIAEDKDENKQETKEKKVNPVNLYLKRIFHNSWTMDIITMHREDAKNKRNNMLYLSLVIAVSIGSIVIAMTIF